MTSSWFELRRGILTGVSVLFFTSRECNLNRSRPFLSHSYTITRYKILPIGHHSPGCVVVYHWGAGLNLGRVRKKHGNNLSLQWNKGRNGRKIINPFYCFMCPYFLFTGYCDWGFRVPEWIQANSGIFLSNVPRSFEPIIHLAISFNASHLCIRQCLNKRRLNSAHSTEKAYQ
jgi:hypothetical protein